MEVLRARCGCLPGAKLGVKDPAVQHTDAAADVAQRDRQIDGLVGHLGDGMAAVDLDPVLIREGDLHRRILEARRHQQRPEPGQQRPLGCSGGSVGRAH